MTDREIGWVAGFLEGEGSFTFHVTAPRITAVQVQREPLDRLRLFFGGTICMKVRKNKPPYFQWTHSSIETAGWMMTLYVLMSPRRRAQISDALALWKTTRRKGWRKYLTHCKRGHAFTSDNTKLQKNGARNCRECLRMLWRRKHLKVIHGHPD